MPPVEPQNIEACDRLKSDDNGRGNKVIVKFSKRKDMAREMNKKKSLKNAILDGTGLALHYSLIVVFAVAMSISELNVKHHGPVN